MTVEYDLDRIVTITAIAVGGFLVPLLLVTLYASGRIGKKNE